MRAEAVRAGHGEVGLPEAGADRGRRGARGCGLDPAQGARGRDRGAASGRRPETQAIGAQFKPLKEELGPVIEASRAANQGAAKAGGRAPSPSRYRDGGGRAWLDGPAQPLRPHPWSFYGRMGIASARGQGCMARDHRSRSASGSTEECSRTCSRAAARRARCASLRDRADGPHWIGRAAQARGG
jgi:hypothetical protein